MGVSERGGGRSCEVGKWVFQMDYAGKVWAAMVQTGGDCQLLCGKGFHGACCVPMQGFEDGALMGVWEAATLLFGRFLSGKGHAPYWAWQAAS